MAAYLVAAAAGGGASPSPNALMRLVNPFAQRMVTRGRWGDQCCCCIFVGRRSGRRYDVPTGYHLIEGVVTVLTCSGWRYNLAGGQEIEVTLGGVH